MKRFLTFALIILMVLFALSGDGGGDRIEYDLVFVNHSDAAIVEVVADFANQLSGARRADSRPLKRGETLGFEAGEYPVTVAVYDQLFEDSKQKGLACITINSAPPEGERWYVIAQDSGQGLRLTADTIWPAGA